MIRLVALDLDGTLLNPDSRLNDVDRDAVLAAKARGAQIVLSTARWYGVAQRTATRLDLETPMICHNGAHVQIANGGEELFHRPVPLEVAREIAAFCDQGDWETYTTVDGMTYMRTPWERMIDPARLPDDMKISHDHASHVTAPATGFVVFSEEAVVALIEAFVEKYDGVLAFSVGRGDSTQTYVSITADGCDKGTALRIVCDHLGIAAEEALAVGDAQPDIDMFDVAAIGVAMGNAAIDVKERADAVAPTNAEGGVAWAINRYVLEGA